MYFSIELYFLLALYYVMICGLRIPGVFGVSSVQNPWTELSLETESVDEFTFRALSLGYSGLLIVWKPTITVQSKETFMKKYIFHFKVFAVGEENYENTELVDLTWASCSSSAGQYKIHSLNGSTLYEIIIRQYEDFERFGTIKGVEYSLNLGAGINEPDGFREYSVRIKTNLKSKKIPTKPHFEYETGIIRWYPCGKERICHDDQESGTHFGIKIREPYNTRKWVEVKVDEFFSDHVTTRLWAGRVYEVVVFSVNGEFETDSDSQEICLNPISTMVQYVNVVSLPDLSVLISWKPPKRLREGLLKHYEVIVNTDSDEEAPYFVYSETNISSWNSDAHYYMTVFYQQIRTRILKLELVYNFVIIPSADGGQYGLEYRMRYKLQTYKNELPIARPNFNYKLDRENGNCTFYFQWLPCGQSFNCENSKPGSEYSFEFSPQISDKLDRKKNGYTVGTFEMDTKYYVSVRSSIGNDSSEPMIKYFKNCTEIRNHTNRNTDEL